MTDKEIEREQEIARKRLWKESRHCWKRLNRLSADSNFNPESGGPFHAALRALDELCHSLEK